MKKKLLAVSVLILSVMFFNCGEKSGDGNNGKNGIIQTKINYKNGDDYTLKYGFTEGLTYTYKISTNSENSQSNGTETQRMKVSISYTLELNPAEVDTNGEADLRVKFLNIKMNADVGGPQISYDSENPADSSKAKSPETAEYAIFKDATFSARINPQGEIIEIYRLDNLINKILGENASTAGEEIKTQIKARMEMQVSSMIQQVFQFLPSETVKINADWSKETTERLDEIASKTTLTYKLIDVKNIDGKDVAFIDANLVSEMEKRKSIQDKGTKYDFKKPEISGKGEVQFNLENGLVLNRNLETNIFTGMTITQGYNSVNITNKAKNIVTVELVK
jgi:hypothetical protein